MKSPLGFGLILGAIALSACASQTPVASGPAANAPCAESHCAYGKGLCPFQIEGTTARAEDFDGGVALVFTTTGDIAALQALVAKKAERKKTQCGKAKAACPHCKGDPAAAEKDCPHCQAKTKGTCPHCKGDPAATEKCTHCKFRGNKRPAVDVEAKNIEGGARLEFKPKDPKDLDALRTRIHAKAK